MPRCRICNAKEQDQRVRAEFVYGGSEEHRFWHCQRCDAVYLFPVPSPEEEAYFYEREFEKFMASRSEAERDWSNAEAHVRSNQDQVRRRWRVLEPYLRAGVDLLEVGCSSGFMLDAFREAGIQCTGVEPSGAFSDFLREKGYTVYKSVDELKARVPEKRFDLVVHFFVFEHVRDPFEFLKSTLGLLKPVGKMIAEIPCVNDPLTSLFEIPAFERFYWSIAHHYYYSPRSIAYVLDSLGVKYRLVPEQRYDLSNHIIWMTKGTPGGQGKFKHVFTKELIEKYKQDLRDKWLCDTMFLIVEG